MMLENSVLLKFIKTSKLEQSFHLKKLGPEPLSEKFNLNYFIKKIKKK